MSEGSFREINNDRQVESRQDEGTYMEMRSAMESQQSEIISINDGTAGPQMEIQMGEERQAQLDMVATTTGINAEEIVEEVGSQALPANVPPLPRAVANESLGQGRATNGSAQRKRSRLGEGGAHSTGSASLAKLHDHIHAIDFHIDNMQRNGAKANTATARAQLSESARGILTEATNLMVKIVSGQEIQLCYQRAEKTMRDRIITLQEENMGLKQQIIELQAKEVNVSAENKNMPMSYMGAALKNMGGKISEGKQLPVPYIAESVKHAPSECIIIFKAEKKGEMLTKAEQEKFRVKVKETIGVEQMHCISAIRPTRFGGHTMIFRTEQQRNMVFEKLKEKERENNISEEKSNMIAPKRKVAKAVCKEPPSDISIEGIKKDMYGRHNPALELIPQVHRIGKIMRTRLGLVFEFSSAEMQAVQMQDWRIRCDMGREIKVEEFIPLQQCYACCKFGHNAEECKAENEACRLCGSEGHSGKNCPHKDDKERWRCINCKRMNSSKNLKLDDKHAAAQLHKCPIAQQQKAVRKIQLAASGVYTTPILKGSDKLENKVPTINNNQRGTYGGREITNINRGGEIDKNKNKGRQEIRQNVLPFSSASSLNRVNIIPSSSTASKFSSSSRSFSSSSSSSSSSSKIRNQDNNDNPCVQRLTKVTRPQTTDGWQTIEKKGGGKKKGESERGRGSLGQAGVNSVNEMNDITIEETEGTMTPYQVESQVYDE